MKIEQQEQLKLEEIVNKYGQLQYEFVEIEQKLNEITNKKNILMSKLEETREDELKLMDDLENKYGKGKIDLNTLEFIQDEQNT